MLQAGKLEATDFIIASSWEARSNQL